MAQSIGALPCVMNATSYDQVEQRVNRAVERFGRIDEVAHCVGSLLLKPAHLTTEEDWTATITTST